MTGSRARTVEVEKFCRRTQKCQTPEGDARRSFAVARRSSKARAEKEQEQEQEQEQ
jgi:hypothetical protein